MRRCVKPLMSSGVRESASVDERMSLSVRTTRSRSVDDMATMFCTGTTCVSSELSRQDGRDERCEKARRTHAP